MKELTAAKAQELIEAWELNKAHHGLSINGEYCLQAMQIALQVIQAKELQKGHDKNDNNNDH